ncbi:MAG: biopolymer transporter ExbD [Colwellia sp.]|nr:biopolymer transporter ExbD [Colwellia sp.]
MTRRKKLQSSGQADVDMTPMLDIVFILLIFFIVTTSFVREEGFEINKPQTNNPPSESSPIVFIKTNANNIIYLNGRMIDINNLASGIENFIANNETNNVVLTPNKDTQYEQVVRILDIIKDVGNLTISIGK